MKPFLETINYSSCNEDSLSERKALRIDKNDRVLCITGSGARPLDLLIQEPAEIVSIDFNPCQNFLFELKMAGIHILEYEQFIEFLGVLPSPGRLHFYEIIKPFLSPEARSFWDNHSKMIEKGVLYQGRWEKYFRKLSWLVSLVRPQLLKELFNSSNIQEQATAWKRWDNSVWHIFLRCISSRVVWKYFFGDPGFYSHVPAEFSIYQYLRERFSYAANNILFCKSPFAMLLFTGTFTKKELPFHLQKKYYSTLKRALPRVKLVTRSLLDFLEHCDKNSFDKFSLSDFSSYTSAPEYERIWNGIIKAASRGAILCERQFLVKREPPNDIRLHIKRNSEMELNLSKTDNSIFYTFVIASFYRHGE